MPGWAPCDERRPDMVRWTREDLDAWPSRKRARTVNSLSGFKSATLVGSVDLNGVHNLSVVSSVVHLGSNPAQMGMVLRPPGDDAHTYKNLMATGQCTFSHIGVDWVAKAHQCSARYPADVSEFDAVGLTPCGNDEEVESPRRFRGSGAHGVDAGRGHGAAQPVPFHGARRAMGGSG